MKNGQYTMLVALDYPGKKYRGRYVYEHHLVWWKKHGYVVPKGYEIHHINRNHRDNRLSNLQLLTNRQHRLEHGRLATEKAMTFYCCDWCGKQNRQLLSKIKTRLKQNKHRIFCNRSCGAKFQFRSGVVQLGEPSAVNGKVAGAGPAPGAKP